MQQKFWLKMKNFFGLKLLEKVLNRYLNHFKNKLRFSFKLIISLKMIGELFQLYIWVFTLTKLICTVVKRLLMP